MRFLGQRARAIAWILGSRVSPSRPIRRAIMATAAEGAKRKITLMSSDREEFEVDEAVAKQSEVLAHKILDGCNEGRIPLNVTARVLAKVLEYCKKHADFTAGEPCGHDGRPATKGEIAAWDADYINVEQDVLFDVIMASNFLNIKSLLNLGCQKVADMIRGKEPNEIRQQFQLQKDFTHEELVELEKEMSRASLHLLCSCRIDNW